MKEYLRPSPWEIAASTSSGDATPSYDNTKEST